MISKKGDVASDFGEVVVAGLVLFLLGMILFYVIDGNTEEKLQRAKIDVNRLEAVYTTRMLLDQKISNDYKMYEFVIDTVNQEKYSDFKPVFKDFVENIYGGKTGSWMIRIKTKKYDYGEFILKGNAKRTEDALLVLPGVIIPNPKGGIIRVLFKQIKFEDYKTVTQVNVPKSYWGI